MPQTSFASTYTTAFEGMLADSFESDIVSKANGEASANLYFGRGYRDNGTGGVINFSAAAQVLLGVSVFEQKDSSRLAVAGEAFAPKEMMNILRKGRIWVKAEQAVALNSPVFVRHTANGGTTAPGRFRIDIDTANATAVTGARWVTTTSAPDQLACLELNLPA